MRQSLDGTWRGEGFGPAGERMTFDGQVPGCVHTDLLRAGRIPDPFWRDQAKECRWIENWNWTYERSFTVDDPAGDAEICFDGLDTYAQVYLNGALIGRADNMFIPYAFPARGLRAGENVLRVAFLSPVAATKGLPERPAAFTCERLHTRRMQCTYSWDWVDRFVTMGIYRSVFLHCPEACEIADLRCETRAIDSFGAQLYCKAQFQHTTFDSFCRLRLTDPEGKTVYEKRRRIVEDTLSEMIDVPHPRLWWPNGYGKQPLYELFAAVETEDGQLLDSARLKVGIRTVRLLQLPDPPGSPEETLCRELKKGLHVSGENAFWDRNEPGEFAGFAVVVNGVRVFCKGANWVPCEPFPSAETPDKIRGLLESMRLAHANMVRVWGGGLFEQDAFYDACDELGLMVTQDFLMACGHYPEDEDWFLDQLRREAEAGVRRLRSHPCLAWWSGDNENAMDADEDMVDYHGRRSALRAIGPVLEEMDPNRPFLPSSPYGGRPYGSITRGTTHNTNYIGQKFSCIRFRDMRDYRACFETYLSRFCAEEPCTGFPSVSSLRRFLTVEDIFGPDEAMLRFHTKNNPSEAFHTFEIYDYLGAIADKLLGDALCPEDRIMKRQYIQYEWIRMTLELYRRHKWFSSGLIYWMLDDCWPACGWALLDYYGQPKAGWYGFKRTAQPLIASIDRERGEYRLHVCSDAPEERRGRARLLLQPFKSAAPRRVVETEFCIPANESRPVLAASFPSAGPGELLLAEISGDGFFDRTCFFEQRPQDCGFTGCPVRVIASGEDFVTLEAEEYAHAVSLDGEAVFEDNFFSLLPGESRTIHFRRLGSGKLCVRVLHSEHPTQLF